MISFFSEFWNNIFNFFIDVFTDIEELLTDIPLFILEAFLNGVYEVFNTIPVPELFSNGLAPLLSNLPPSIAYILVSTGFNEALSLLGVGITFRLLRKLFTLGQW